MTIRRHTRREILGATAALTATASVGAVIRHAAAQGAATQANQIDACSAALPTPGRCRVSWQ